MFVFVFVFTCLEFISILFIFVLISIQIGSEGSIRCENVYGVATISRLHKIIGLF